MKIKNLPRHERPREKLIEKGATALKDKELLAILLGTGRAGKNVIEVAAEILVKHKMKKLLALPYSEMARIKGIGPAKATSLLAAFELTKRALEVEDNNLPTINNAKDAVAQLQELRTAKKEHFVALYLNARNQLIHKETISIGILNASLVHPREVFKPAIEHLAASVILAHNHPGGETEPSRADEKITERLREAGKLLGVDVKDHIIITNNAFTN
ncbi:DNA repair protein RadC [Patescibacteria group bacterium]|nr:DNA repair protein RadC [Patescibacteria group bacterium]MBU4347164.1 DNA repair protein RadC [Patescibacteria group bacterium]MBU4455165.1 DNA repair protein RadC [Patescibacteria group bacterium]